MEARTPRRGGGSGLRPRDHPDRIPFVRHSPGIRDQSSYVQGGMDRRPVSPHGLDGDWMETGWRRDGDEMDEMNEMDGCRGFVPATTPGLLLPSAIKQQQIKKKTEKGNHNKGQHGRDGRPCCAGGLALSHRG